MMHWYIAISIHNKIKAKYQYSLEFLFLGENDFTNNYPVFTQMHTFSLLGKMPLTSKID
jgi:hypothetical protein